MMLILLACPATEPECLDDSWCAEGQACLGGTCFEVACTRSDHCPPQQRCTEGNLCVDGCDADADCLAGDRCSQGVCAAPACEVTELDCGLGELCDADLGECVASEFDLCGPCQDGACDDGVCVTSSGDECVSPADCAEGWTCEQLTLDPKCQGQASCPDGFTCLEDTCVRSECRLSVCLETCDPTAPSCPGGFLCNEVRGGGAVCNADCGYLLEHGYL